MTDADEDRGSNLEEQEVFRACAVLGRSAKHADAGSVQPSARSSSDLERDTEPCYPPSQGPRGNSQLLLLPWQP